MSEESRKRKVERVVMGPSHRLWDKPIHLRVFPDPSLCLSR